MVVGLSIAHGSPGSNTPSIVSATFSCDAAVYRYIHKAKLQEKGVGLITCLKELMIEGCKVSFSFKTSNSRNGVELGHHLKNFLILSKTWCS